MKEQQLTQIGDVAVLTGVFVGSIQEPDWNLLDITDPHNSRSFDRFIQFEKGFSSVPVVQVSLTGFDVDNKDNARVRIRSTNAQLTGFSLQIETWLHTRMWSVEVSWLAIGSP